MVKYKIVFNKDISMANIYVKYLFIDVKICRDVKIYRLSYSSVESMSCMTRLNHNQT